MTTPVQVFCRVRPSSQDSVEGLKVIENSSRIILPSPRNHLDAITYSFNRVFGPDSNEKDIWQACKPTILDSLKGKNSSIFAYGQTGSGKTHTMLSCQGSVVQSTILELLNHKNVSLTASYIEIYNEKIFDLLSGSETCLELRQNGSSISLNGCTAVNISSLEDFERQLQSSLKNRSTASTHLNQASSRSHFILQLQLSIFGGDTGPLSSKIHLIDLAGSEDNKRTNNSGVRMDESCAINKSLFVLGQVVEALNKKLPRVPYRDSKITRFLQDSLGGSAQTILISCISPNSFDLLDSYNTLNFASKSSLIKNVVSVNEYVHVAPKPLINATAERLEALKEWKKNKISTLAAPPKRLLSEKVDTAQNLSDQFQRDLSLKLSKEFESTIEKRVNARIKEIAANLMSSSTFQKAVSDKFAEVHKKIDSKLETLIPCDENYDKENVGHEQNTPEKTSFPKKCAQNIVLIDSPDLEEVKSATKEKILHIINRGNVKTIMSLKTIGKKRAEAILDAREANGEYTSLEDQCILEKDGEDYEDVDDIYNSNDLEDNDTIVPLTVSRKRGIDEVGPVDISPAPKRTSARVRKL